MLKARDRGNRMPGSVLLIGVTMCLVLLAGGNAFGQTSGTFSSTGSMNVARRGQTATLLSNGAWC